MTAIRIIGQRARNVWIVSVQAIALEFEDIHGRLHFYFLVSGLRFLTMSNTEEEWMNRTLDTSLGDMESINTVKLVYADSVDALPSMSEEYIVND